MRLYIKTCSNLEILSTEEQRTLCKKFVNPALWSTVEFLRGDNMEVMVKRVEEAFNRLQPAIREKEQTNQRLWLSGGKLISKTNKWKMPRKKMNTLKICGLTLKLRLPMTLKREERSRGSRRPEKYSV